MTLSRDYRFRSSRLYWYFNIIDDSEKEDLFYRKAEMLKGLHGDIVQAKSEQLADTWTTEIRSIVFSRVVS